MPAATAGGGATIGVPPNAEPKGLASGAAAVQLGGTDKVPTVAALPRPAATVPPSPPAEPSGATSAPPSPPLVASPNTSPAASAAATPPSRPKKGAIVLLGKNSPDEAIVFQKLELGSSNAQSLSSQEDPDPRMPSNPDGPDADVAAVDDESPCSTDGMAAISCDSVVC